MEGCKILCWFLAWIQACYARIYYLSEMRTIVLRSILAITIRNRYVLFRSTKAREREKGKRTQTTRKELRMIREPVVRDLE